jgi:putative DNA primase/helicase
MPDRTIVPFPSAPPDADEHARAETERKQRLFEWADRILADLGLADKVRNANTLDDLRRITFDERASEIGLAIRDALHPATGRKHDSFVGMNEGMLRRLLKMRFNERKKEREAELRRGHTAGASQTSYDWTSDLKLDDKSAVRPLLHNLILFLRHHQQWQGVLGFNEFTAQVVIRQRPPWGEEALDTPWNDHHETLTRRWFQTEDINATLGDVGRAVQAAARANSFHPVRDYFDGLVWDGTPRLDRWLVTYFHADDTPYVRAIGPRWLMSSVARIYRPGCQVDHTLVLEGPQGRLKSQALRTLPKNQSWFTDRLSHIGSKDAAIEITGIQIVELAEMDALTKAASSTSKAYLTRQHDRFRPPYGKHPINLRRQCVFAATINPPTGGYLKDPTGARRFWPVACHGMIDCDALERDRDQLWAEAVARYRASAKWWLESPELEALATTEQRLRYRSDPWREIVERWICRRNDVSIPQVLKDSLKIPPREQTQRAENRVASILTSLGFTKYRPRRNGKRPYRYCRENAPNQTRTTRTT